MNTSDVHRHIDNLGAIAWYRVRFPDAGAGATRIHAFIQADSEEAARAIAGEHEVFAGYDTEGGTVERVGSLWSDIEHAVVRAGGPNMVLGQDGTVTRRSDLDDV